jgi:ribosome-associated toxin RatA of RatAB toxin-antitoxin module
VRTVGLRAVATEVDPKTAYDRISDFARYPALIDTVVSVEVGDADHQAPVSTWTVKFRRGLMRWTERDVLDRNAGTIEFEQLSGDFASFRGIWRITATEEGTEVGFAAEFDLGMPTLADMLNPVAESALRDNIRLILSGLLGDIELVEPTERA